MKRFLLILSFLITFMSLGQSSNYNLMSLEKKNYSELYDKALEYIRNDNYDPAEKYLDFYLSKAKKANNNLEISNAFFLMNWLYNAEDKRVLTVLDSSIYYAKKIKKNNGIARKYNRRAIYYNDIGDLSNCLSDYLEALKYAKQNENDTFIYVVKHNIGILKRELGKYKEAKKIFNECLVYDEINMINKKGRWDTIHYVETLFQKATTYRLNKQLDSAKILNNKALKLSEGLEKDVSLLNLNDAILNYQNQKFIEAKEKLISCIPSLTKAKYEAEPNNFIEAYLYLGLSFKNLNMREDAIKNFKKADSIYDIQSKFIPEIITVHKELVEYYKSIGNEYHQLIYINKLIKADSIINNNYKIIGDRLFREFDTKELIEEKEQIISSLAKENFNISNKNIIISILLLLSIGIASFYFYRQQLYKKRFLKLVADRAENNNTIGNRYKTSPINEETLQHLLHNLQQFEDEKKYLDTGISLVELAKKFNSNSTYLSKAINKYKSKSFTQYINDLRVDYVVDKLKNDSIFRKYTVLALAQEVGFNNPESFSKAFYKKTGIYPSFFIKELLKQ